MSKTAMGELTQFLDKRVGASFSTLVQQYQHQAQVETIMFSVLLGVELVLFGISIWLYVANVSNDSWDDGPAANIGIVGAWIMGIAAIATIIFLINSATNMVSPATSLLQSLVPSGN